MNWRKKYLFVSILILIVAISLFAEMLSKAQHTPAVTTRFPNRIQEVLPSVVHIRNITRDWQGSGFAITKNIIVTARHVVEGGNDFIITLNDGSERKSIRAVSSKKYDIGFIKVDDPNLVPVELGEIEDCRLGQRVFVIGSQFGISHFNSVTLGIISAIQRDWGESWGWQVTFQIDAGANPGSSGGPVFNMAGEVIGIVVGSPTQIFAGVIYIVPISLIEDLNVVNSLFLLDEYYFEKVQEYETAYTK